jgi:hypothetical protein
MSKPMTDAEIAKIQTIMDRVDYVHGGRWGEEEDMTWVIEALLDEVERRGRVIHNAGLDAVLMLEP